jgi:hypothetical protein
MTIEQATSYAVDELVSGLESGRGRDILTSSNLVS